MTRTDHPSLRKLFFALQEELRTSLITRRTAIPHAGEKGTASELRWLGMLETHLPRRYQATKGFVLDSRSRFSKQIDVIIYDPHYSPLLFQEENVCFVPAESVYAIFEVKQEISKATLRDAAEKAESVRVLHRTSVPIQHAGGTYEPVTPKPIPAGILALESSWSGPFGDAFVEAVCEHTDNESLQIGCALTNGAFQLVLEEDAPPSLVVSEPEVALISFFLSLLSLLQGMATVPAIDLSEYAKALAEQTGGTGEAVES